MALIETKNLTKVFGGADVEVTAVNNLSLTIEKGEFTAIVGPSGSGKTTLLNMIGGLDRPTSGEVLVSGRRLYDLSDKELTRFRLENIGFVFQAYNLIPVLSAYENTEFTMLLQNRPEAERRQRTISLLERVGLGGRMDARPKHLSGGQQQRVAVARALAPKPAFILADEPTANLDSAATGNLLDMMAEMNKEEGVTFVFSTHDQRVIDRARRVVTLEDGRIIQDEFR